MHVLLQVVRRWILDGKVAPRFPSVEEYKEGADSHDHDAHSTNSECPICCWQYIANNTTTCCKKPLCTECYLQVRPPKAQISCPFCNSSKFSVIYSGPTTAEELEAQIAEEQKLIEAQIAARRSSDAQQEQDAIKRRADLAAADHGLTTASAKLITSSQTPPPRPGGTEAFFMDLKREDGAAGRSHSLGSAAELKCATVTVAARKELEREMRAQHSPSPTAEFGLFGASAAGGTGPSRYDAGRQRGHTLGDAGIGSSISSSSSSNTTSSAHGSYGSHRPAVSADSNIEPHLHHECIASLAALRSMSK